MECPYCKAENRDGVRYCGSCGKMIGTSAAATPGGDNSRSLAPGSRLQGGRYVVKQVLGQGGMGTALLATDLRLDSKPVVIKELLSDNVDPSRLQEDVRNFKREVATLAHIDHPLIPAVTDHFQEGTRYFMVQEYVEGETLEELLNRTQQPMQERDALICASEVLDILDYLSQQTPPIVHRDIKPANIIIGARDKKAHLVDFGIARADAARNAQRKQTSALGTPGYAPPEQYQGNADPRSDLYALAATLHHLLTRRDPRNYPPFAYPPVRMFNPQLSSDIEEVLTHALTNDINHRYQSAMLMKQDIDKILQQRYGITGNVSSYTLSTSGTMNAVSNQNTVTAPTAVNVSNQPTVINPATPLPAVAVSAQPSHGGASQPQSATPGALYQPGTYAAPAAQKRQNRLGCYVLAVIVALAIIVGGAFSALRYLQPSTNVGGNGIGVSLVNNEAIGISDGTFVFDGGRPSGTFKSQAAQLLRQQNPDVSAALSLLNQGVARDSNDAEALIYLENLRVLNSASPYVNFIVGTMLSGDPGTVGVGRDDLQGAYVAQKEFNDGSKLTGGIQIRLLIANTGSQTSYTTQVAHQIVQLAHADPHFAGVMGWPYSSRAVEAVGILAAAHIPMVSQTASSDLLTNTSPYFFRVVPSNKIQGIEGARYAEQTLHAKTVALFYDPSDPYSQSLAQDFRQQFEADGNAIAVEKTYTVGQSEKLPGLLRDALTHNPDIIYFSGYANDVSAILANLPPGSNLPVMGGDALYELNGYPGSARAGFSHLHFTAFAYPDEWIALGYGDRAPAFFAEYINDFDPNRVHTAGIYGYTRADNDVILSYDAMLALLQGYNIALSSGKQSVTPEELQQGLRKVTGDQTVQGVSGQIAFGPNGDPVDKAIVILFVDPEGHIKIEPAPLGRFLK
ncbi:MAG TPA: ABC transporter substrate-binding protein [Ktedonobacteraceae bacterium]|nr:ABC transporter substrate-binding protein [Ktedonobacteraceae bacterium]